MINEGGMATVRTYRQGHLLCAAFLVMATLGAEAATTSDIRVKVVVLAPPCVINSNNTIEVNFGNDVLTTRVDGNYKKMLVKYSLLCGSASDAVKLLIDGNGADFAMQVLRTNKTDVGIEILNNSQRLPINSWLNFTYPNLPKLEAVIVKRPGSTLTGGPFSASATLKVEYQ